MNDLNSNADKKDRMEILNRYLFVEFIYSFSDGLISSSIIILLIIFVIGGVARFVKTFLIDLSGTRFILTLNSIFLC
jgi:hypothetical protein